jgi:hypothetical protein
VRIFVAGASVVIGVRMVMHQLTDLPDKADEIAAFRERNNRMRGEGTRNLIAAARAAGAERFLAQSIAWRPPGGEQSVAEHERAVLDYGGVALEHGQLYGPGTYYANELRIRRASRSTRPPGEPSSCWTRRPGW